MKWILAGILALISFSAQAGPTFTRTRILMGDVPVFISIRAPRAQKIQAFKAMDQAFDEAVRLENQLSEFKPTSDTSRVNRMGLQKCVAVGDDLISLLKFSEIISQASDGAFDVTYASENKHASYKNILIKTKTTVIPWLDHGIHNLEPLDPAVEPRGDRSPGCVQFLKPGMQIRVSGIAKGTIVEAMSKKLISLGFPIHLVNAGGDLKAMGKWKSGIRYLPFHLSLHNQGASTSGLSERGQHIFYPHSMKPVVPRHYTGVTVIAPTEAIADALDTPAFILGPRKTREKLLPLFPNVSFYFVTSEKTSLQIYREDK